MAGLPTKIAWSPNPAFHDPDPPLRLLDFYEVVGTGVADGDSSALAVSVTIVEAVGLAEGDSAAAAVGANGNTGVGLAEGGSSAVASGESIAEAVGLAEGDSSALGVVVNVIEAVGLAEADSSASAGGATILESVGTATGSSTANAIGRGRVAAEGTFTYLAVDPTAAIFLPRRRPEIGISTQIDDSSPNSIVYSISTNEPLVGQQVVADLGDGALFEGPIVRVDEGYEGRIDQPVWTATASDYRFFLNRRRPFGCFEDVSVSTIIESLMDDFTQGFTYDVIAGLPAVSVDLDGTRDFVSTLTYLTSLVGAHWRLNVKELKVFLNDIDDQPDDIDDANMSLLRNPPVLINRDITQIRTRVYGKGAEAVVVAPVAVGATSMLVSGLDLFSDGDTILVGGQIITYTGRESNKVLVSQPAEPDSSGLLAAPRLYSDLSTEYQVYSLPTPLSTAYELGRIKGTVRYSVAVIDDFGESVRTPLTAAIVHTDYQPFRYGSAPPGFLAISVVEGVDQSYDYLFVWRMDDGQLTTARTPDQSARTFVGAAGTPSLTFTNLPQTSYPHVWGIWVYRKRAGTYYLVGKVPNGTTTFLDDADDADLVIPFVGDTSSVATTGIQIKLTGIPTGGRARRIYRKDNNLSPTLLVTLNDGITDEYVDNKPVATTPTPTPSAPCPPIDTDAEEDGTSAEGLPIWAAQDPGEPLPQEPESTIFRLIGIPSNPEAPGAVHCPIEVGEKAYLWVQADDLAAQVALAETEGGDGVHEDVVVDQSIVSRAELIRRVEAELLMWSSLILTVKYATRDRKTKPGKTVVFNLSNPAISATLKIQDVVVDQIHETTGVVERYTATASSIRFTLDDLLRRVVLR